MIYLNYLAATVMWVILMALRLIMIVIGFAVVPVALRRRYEADSPRPKGTWDAWEFIRLPKWAWFWDNERDGCLGDNRGNYRFEQSPEWLRKSEFWLAFNWLAIRNPANNFSRFTPLIACDMQDATCTTLQGQDHVRDKVGEEGFRFVRAIGKWKIPYWGLYWVSDFRIKDRNLVIRIGHKMDVFDNDQDYSADPQKAWKGMTFRIGFQKM